MFPMSYLWVYQMQMTCLNPALWELLKGLAGGINIADDILVFRATQEEHDNNVISFLDRCLKVNFQLNADKVKLNCKEVLFF